MLSADESTHVGQISKQWSGLAKELFTDADNFGVTFPIDMDVKTKATILGAVFLIVSVLLLFVVSGVSVSHGHRDRGHCLSGLV